MRILLHQQLLTLLQPYQPPCCSSKIRGTIQTQDLITCYSFCQESSFPKIFMAHPLISFGYFLKFIFSVHISLVIQSRNWIETFLPFQMPPTPHSRHALSPFLDLFFSLHVSHYSTKYISFMFLFSLHVSHH